MLLQDERPFTAQDSSSPAFSAAGDGVDSLPSHWQQRAQLVLQLRQKGITDIPVLNAMESVPRHLFVPDTFASRAYEDIALPIASGQTISQPSIVAWMTWALQLDARSRVLEIGTGSGYQAAVLSKLCRMVYTIERHDYLYQTARERFLDMGLQNIHTRLGDGTKGWPESAPFDRIIVTAAAPEIPHIYLNQLRDGGILIIPVGTQGQDQWLVRMVKQGDSFHMQHMMPVRFVPLEANS